MAWPEVVLFAIGMLACIIGALLLGSARAPAREREAELRGFEEAIVFVADCEQSWTAIIVRDMQDELARRRAKAQP